MIGPVASKPSKPKQAERRDVVIKQVCVATWRRARLDALKHGVVMADWLEAAIRKVLSGGIQ